MHDVELVGGKNASLGEMVQHLAKAGVQVPDGFATTAEAVADCAHVYATTVRKRGVTKPVTLTFTWTPGAQPVLTGKATVKRLDFGVGGGARKFGGVGRSWLGER